jgi:hypothetical protein
MIMPPQPPGIRGMSDKCLPLSTPKRWGGLPSGAVAMISVLSLICAIGISRPSYSSNIGPNTFELLPYQADNYSSLVLRESASPPPGFEQPGFDDTSFQLGSGAFGSGGNCTLQANATTLWPTNTQLLVRRLISVPAGATGLQIKAAVDNDIIGVFFNGTNVQGPIRHEGCPILDEVTILVPQELIVPGENLLVFHVLDRGVESFFDARVLAEVSADVLSSTFFDLSKIVNSQLPKVPVSNIAVNCPEGSRTISVDFSILSTGSRGSINITQESLTDFTARAILNGTEISKVQRRTRGAMTTKRVDINITVNNQNDMNNLLSLSQILGSPSASSSLVSCISASRGDLSCEKSISSNQCVQCCSEVATEELDACLNYPDGTGSGGGGLSCISVMGKANNTCLQEKCTAHK